MSDVVIRVENLSKKYVIGHQKKERYTALRDVVANGARSFLRGVTGKGNKDFDDLTEDFWALKDVSFEIKQGDRVGIIGRNGAGKSTLLKILSRITEPTSGKISIKGRVASLLEVGTGFHPELTGRENVYLNGAILGMDRVEIKRKFDEIVAFAEVEKFLDTPVKRYSSGMYVRLAFAVAAHLEPEILIVDEVLAVGDADFQKKCLGKMGDITEKEGKTILFVSHNMVAIEHLCNKGLFLQKGQLSYSGNKEETIQMYLASSKVGLAKGNHIFAIEEDVFRADQFQILKILFLDHHDSPIECLRTWDDLKIRIHYNSPSFIKNAGVVLMFRSQTGVDLIHCSTQPMSGVDVSFKKGTSFIDCVINKLPLASGQYSIGAYLTVPFVRYLFSNDSIAYFEVFPKNIYDSDFPPKQSYSPIALNYHWVKHE